ncbi:MAG: histidine phosphatase family protein [Cyanobacteria bacterium J06554_11]
MSLYLYFLRHGETTHSRTGGYCGWFDPELTESGLQMAQSFAETYKGLAWEAVFCSPMRRTMATARPLCEAIGIEPQLREGLKEMSYGDWEDRQPDYVKEHFGEDFVRWQREPAWNPPTGGETALQVASRASLVIAEIEENYSSGNVLVVCHKTTIRIVLCSLLGIDLGRYRDRIDMPVATVSVVRFDKYGPMLIKMGDRTHLSEALRNREGT